VTEHHAERPVQVTYRGQHNQRSGPISTSAPWHRARGSPSGIPLPDIASYSIWQATARPVHVAFGRKHCLPSGAPAQSKRKEVR